MKDALRNYRVVWLVLTFALGGLGAVVALLSVKNAILATMVVTSVLVSSGLWFVVRYVFTDTAAPSRREGTGQLASCVMVSVAGCLAFMGLVALIGPPAVWVTISVAVVSPYALRGWYALARRGIQVVDPPPCVVPVTTAETAPHQPAEEPVAGPSVDVVIPSLQSAVEACGSLTDAELCTAWRRSFTALQRVPHGSHPEHARLVAARQEFLDELERRDPTGFHNWLAAGARPASDPSRYIKPSQP